MELLNIGKFQSFKDAKYTVDVIFHMTNKPCGNFKETQSYYSKKYAQHGYKVEVGVTKRGYAIGCTKHFRGGLSDIDIFYEKMEFRDEVMKQKGQELEVDDDGELSEEYPEFWIALADKGYQGAQRTHRVF